MTETTLPPEGGDRIEPVDIQQEMQNSYIDYAMSVIVGRALPDVRDGLKPVHRRVLYAMYDNGYRPDRGYVKSARPVAETMGNYHPHGDSSIYDTLVRMAQPWSLRYPLVDGQGNFGSRGNDGAAAMRYCVTGDALVATPDGDVPIVDLVAAEPNSTVDCDLKVIGLHGNAVRATAFHHSGHHPVLTVSAGAQSLTCTTNHPVLCQINGELSWKLAGEIRIGDLLASTVTIGQDSPRSERKILPDRGALADWRHVPDAPPVDSFGYVAVTAVTAAGVQPVFSLRVDTDDHAFITNGFVSHNTECRLTPLAMEMLRDIDEETVDFVPNYDGRTQEPTVLPSRIPNLLVNGSGGIAVGMATNIPPHNLGEVAEGVYWCLDNWEADEESTLEAMIQRVKGPDFPTSALIVGGQGIQDAYRTGRGSVRMRGVVSIEEERSGSTTIVITELPFQVNPDNLISSIAEQVRDGKIAGISKIEDHSSDRVGMRIVITLRRDAVAKVVLNNLYKHSQLQTSFGCNMLSIVDGVPRTLRLDQMIRYYVKHQIEVIYRRTVYRLRKAEERAHILRGLVKALDMLDEVIALIRRSPSAEESKSGLMTLLDVDEIQATAILDMQLRRLAALERQKIIDDLAKIEAEIADLKDILAKPERQRAIVKGELSEIVEKYGDDRRTKIIAAEGDVTDEDLIAREDVVVTITETGYAKRTKTDLYRAQKRGGKGVQGAGLKQDDIVRHFFVSSTHDWLLFFTNKGRVYRAKAYELPEANRTARGQHVANLLAFQPDEKIAQVIQIKSYEDAPYLVLATKRGLVKKSRLVDFDSNRTGGVIGINLRDGDELVGAILCSSEDDLLLVSAQGQSIRFSATDEALRPMGRATSGVTGMRFNEDDELLSLNVVVEGSYLLVATSGGYSKRTALSEYSAQNRGGKGVLTIMYDRRRGNLVGAVIVDDDDELYAITTGGGVIRTAAKQVRKAGRQTKGVRLMNLGEGVDLLAIARNADEPDEPDIKETK
ncbi:DNA gyrase subunit A [Smaragdicoccus niigatensis]|uniref:DNA gyrase subunit A n=1 Tax=Smaragdicoccus niigatensis TaxID=359359 RepID=UPI000369F468|nr:DNA gyrase subunit A [Smaragdicoccus niigatensis]